MILLAMTLAGCLVNEALYEKYKAELADDDGDGWLSRDDCNDDDAAVFPKAEETCNGEDDDCDGDVDEEAVDIQLWYRDVDGDGHGRLTDPVSACDPPTADAVVSSDDCDDADALTFTGADERAYDRIDQDCDGEDLADVDGDGAVGSGAGGPDCNDEDASISPSAIDVCADDVDQDCDGSDSLDCDGDGFDGVTLGGDDCNDADATISPGAVEGWSDFGSDNDCDGRVDDDISLGLADADVIIDPPPGAAYFGGSFAYVGDIDGDLAPDLWIAAPLDVNGGGASGAVYRIGSAAVAAGGSLDIGVMGAGLTGTGVDETFGGSISQSVVDGVPTLIASAARYHDSAGVIWAIDPDAVPVGAFETVAAYGSPVAHGEDGDFPGSRLRADQDVDGDGRDDLLVDVLASASVVGVSSVSAADIALADADWNWNGAAGHYLFPTAVGDINDDGYDDVGLVDGSAGIADLGVSVVAGGPTLASSDFGSATVFGLFGPTGIAPVVELAPGVRLVSTTQYQGSVFVSPETPASYDPLLDADYQLFRGSTEGGFEAASTSFWMGAIGAGVVFCSPTSDDGANRGDCVVWQSNEFGHDEFASDAQVRVLGESGGDQAGSRVDANTDLNADGDADLLITAPLNDGSGPDAGRVYIEFSP